MMGARWIKLGGISFPNLGPVVLAGHVAEITSP